MQGCSLEENPKRLEGPHSESRLDVKASQCIQQQLRMGDCRVGCRVAEAEAGRPGRRPA